MSTHPHLDVLKRNLEESGHPYVLVARADLDWAVSLLESRLKGHIVRFDVDHWVMRHPIDDDPDPFNCPYNDFAAQGPPDGHLGDYRVYLCGDGTFELERMDQ